MDLFTDAVTSGIERALSGVSQRQRVTANNIANVATPGFKASRVDFEADLAAAFGRGNPADAAPSITAANTPASVNGNNVSLDEETQIMLKAGLQYEALVQALNYKLGLIRTAIGR
jgi:flagellar basal-body rod protein FlgB